MHGRKETSVTCGGSCLSHVNLFWGKQAEHGKESDCNAEDASLIPGSGRFPWRKEWVTTPVFLPGEFLDRRAWWATVHGVTKSQKQLSN